MGIVFLGSFLPNYDLPSYDEPRIAFLGRSNVGKSSVINLLTGSRIARVSKLPGRTQTLNLFLVEQRWILGDFPGYGFAKVSKKQRREWEELMETFLKAEYFQFAVQIVDARHPGMETDIRLHTWLKKQRLPHLIVMNKADKLNQKERVEAERQAHKTFVDQPLLFVSSSTGEGKRELEQTLRKLTRESHG